MNRFNKIFIKNINNNPYQVSVTQNSISVLDLEKNSMVYVRNKVDIPTILTFLKQIDN